MLTSASLSPYAPARRTAWPSAAPGDVLVGLGSRNGLVRALPAEALAQLWPRLERVELKRRQVLHERNVPLAYAYFLEKGAASLLACTADRGNVEVGLLGRADFVGLPLVLGTGRTPHRCIMQTTGTALRIAADDLAQALADIPALRELLLHYAQAAMVEIAQLAVCNASHSLKQRLARCLLMTHDRMEGNEIPLTHQILSRALGVRRAGVTTAMGRMEQAGWLDRRRGSVLVADREGLEAEACECYRAIRSEYRRFLCLPEKSPPRAIEAGGDPLPLAS